ncbi:cupin domain-containing protein [Methanobacterium sp.]|jgi:quercetin dioxygenase-like cupin family protein|uniref:cupin domain-containing protein n=1 Tax=Methanobacterium sp. TaxID=2164 RepID=UPI0031597E3A
MSAYKIGKTSEEDYIKVFDGIERKTLVYGDNTLLAEFKLEKGKILPAHSHPEEQTGYLVSGRIILIINGEKHEMKPGDSWAIPGEAEHGAETVEDSVAVEIFSPVREDYIRE